MSRRRKPQHPSTASVVKTGIGDLDDLLGGGLAPGSVLLIKGGPGAGKTTLSSQILAHAVGTKQYCVYLPLEEQPYESLARLSRCFASVTKNYSRYLAPIEFNEDQFAKKSPKSLFLALVEFFVNVGKKARECFAKSAAAKLQRSNSIPQGTEQLQHLPRPSIAFVAIDSLSALLDRISVLVQPPPSDREAILHLLRALRTKRVREALVSSQPIIIFTSELRSNSPVLHQAESFLSKAVIELHEQVVNTNYGPELLRFCSVKKSRDRRNHTRRCCYDFSTAGLTFYPTYAADGKLFLFEENASQCVDNHETAISVPVLHPLVQVDRFSRSALQSTFAVHRSGVSTPLRHSMVLCDFDEYWIKALAGASAQVQRLESIPQGRLKLYLSNTGDDVIRELDVKGLHKFNQHWIAVPHFANCGVFVYLDSPEIGIPSGPTTWEEVEAACITHKKHFLIETQTYDSFMSFVLEWFWSHGVYFSGGVPASNGTSQFTWRGNDAAGGMKKIVNAMIRLNRWVFRDGIIPQGSTVDPTKHDNSTWYCARHWYSTLSDLMFEQDNGSLLRRQMQTSLDLERVRVCRIPISKEYRDEQIRNSASEAKQTLNHHSAWGEWYLGVYGGSENLSLAIDLINSLMTSGKVVRRALTGAGLPTTELFYTMYGRCMCPGTALSFSQFLDMFFEDAYSRSDIHDYPRAARILYGPCYAIVSSELKETEIGDLMRGAFDEIQSSRR